MPFVLSVALKKILVKLRKTKPSLGRFCTGNKVSWAPSEGNKQNCVLQCWSATDWLISYQTSVLPILHCKIHVHLSLLVWVLGGYGPRVKTPCSEIFEKLPKLHMRSMTDMELGFYLTHCHLPDISPNYRRMWNSSAQFTTHPADDSKFTLAVLWTMHIFQARLLSHCPNPAL